MPKIKPFEKYPTEYEAWFERNKALYASELNAIRTFIPANQYGVEIGVGTGRFAVPLHIRVGVEPAPALAALARKKGMSVYEHCAEALPFPDDIFDFALMVTVICFVDDIEKAFQESYRILKPKGLLIVCFIDKNSRLGQQYQQEKAESRFYEQATFYGVEDVTGYLSGAGFEDFEFRQTIFDPKAEGLQPVKKGYGEGGFVVIKGVKKTIHPSPCQPI